jgi:DNA polymerase II small subunit/DNA polymerase delta subunit B
LIIDGANSESEVVENDGDVTDAEEGRERGDRPITILRNTLKWGHLCPTAPGT